MRRSLGTALLVVVVAGCGVTPGPASSPTTVAAGPASSSVPTTTAATTTSTTTTDPVESSPTVSSTTPTTVPDVDVDLSELDGLLDQVEQTLAQIDLTEDEGDLP